MIYIKWIFIIAFLASANWIKPMDPAHILPIELQDYMYRMSLTYEPIPDWITWLIERNNRPPSAKGLIVASS